ncbi:MAG: 30S ribosomal protein S8e [Thermoprotei archaeon]|nr:MAG: 30S ribosomal protein S8e [Thermoprotei archaeon]
MGVWHGRDLKKPTGGRIRPHRGKRRREMGSYPTETVAGEDERRVNVRVMGGNYKTRVKVASYVNVSDRSTGTPRKLRILQVVSNPASVGYSRRGVITKGALVKTEAGLVKVSSRPGQEGVVNGVLVEAQP